MKAIYKWGAGALVSYVGFALSSVDVLTGGIDWVAIVERLGIPSAFLVALIWMIYRGTKAVGPILQEEFSKLTSVPQEQLRLEREERMERRKYYEEVMLVAVRDQATSNLKISESLEGLTKAITELVVGTGSIQSRRNDG